MSRIQKLLLTVCVVGVVGTAAGFATFAAFSSTTSNTGNTFDTGTVVVADNDANSAMYSVSGRKPGDTITRCIKVTYTGSLAADVKLYTLSTLAAGAQYIDLTIDKGTGNAAFPGCTGFSADAGGPIFTGTLASFASAKNSYANGIAAYPGAQTAWNTSDTLVYRFTLTVQDNNSAQGMSLAAHDFTWEARNQ